MFVIEDQLHASILEGEYGTLEDALEEIRRLATIPWDRPPNVAPCSSWMTCGRDYVIVEYDDSDGSWTELRRIAAFEISISEYRLHV